MANNSVNISLLSCVEIEGATVINRRALRRLGAAPVTVDMNVRLLPDMERNLISLVVGCTYVAVIGLIRTHVFTCTSLTTFEVENLKEQVEQRGEDQIIGGKLMMTMLGIAVGALRGMVAVRTADTPLRHTPLPMIDLTSLMYRLHYGNRPSESVFRI
ncbi:MAG: hypothetical protein HDS99_00185 [Bacteroidales bacterium]|nr:hypothetical protein [Bacteroidales bacterium]